MFTKIEKLCKSCGEYEQKLRDRLESTMQQWAAATADMETMRFSLDCSVDEDQVHLESGSKDWKRFEGGEINAAYPWNYAKIDTIVSFFERLPIVLASIPEKIQRHNEKLIETLEKIS